MEDFKQKSIKLDAVLGYIALNRSSIKAKLLLALDPPESYLHKTAGSVVDEASRARCRTLPNCFFAEEMHSCMDISAQIVTLFA